MKKSVTLIAVVLFVFLNSCIKNSDWEEVIIPANQELTFLESEEFDYVQPIAFLINERDTLFVNNSNLFYRICYIRAAFPENSIRISYVKTTKNEKNSLSPRFVYLHEKKIN